MNLFQILVVDCNSALMSSGIAAVKAVFALIQWAIPAVLIVLGTIDMFKAMASGDEKKTKEARETFIRRLIYALVAFLIPFIIGLVFELVGNILNSDVYEGGDIVKEFFACWNGE